MRTLVLQLYNRKNRPTFSYVSNGEEVTALFDSGAEAPVWCAGEKNLQIAVCYHPLIGCDFVGRGRGREIDLKNIGHNYDVAL